MTFSTDVQAGLHAMLTVQPSRTLGDQAAAKRLTDAAIEEFAEPCRVTPQGPAIRMAKPSGSN